MILLSSQQYLKLCSTMFIAPLAFIMLSLFSHICGLSFSFSFKGQDPGPLLFIPWCLLKQSYPISKASISTYIQIMYKHKCPAQTSLSFKIQLPTQHLICKSQRHLKFNICKTEPITFLHKPDSLPSVPYLSKWCHHSIIWPEI